MQCTPTFVRIRNSVHFCAWHVSATSSFSTTTCAVLSVWFIHSATEWAPYYGFLWYFLCYRFGWTHILSRRCRTVPKRLVWKNRRKYKLIVHDDYDYDDEDDYDDPWHEPRVTKVVEDECYSHNDDADGDGDVEGDDATVYIRRNRGRRCATALVDGEFPTLVNEFSFIESNRIETTGISLFPLPE